MVAGMAKYSFPPRAIGPHSRQPRLARSFEHVVAPEHIEDFRNGNTVYLIN